MSLYGPNIFVPPGPLLRPSASYSTVSAGKLDLGKVVNQQVSGTLTLAQLQNLYTTPIQVLPALNTGFMYEVDKVIVEAVYGSAAFTGGGNIYLQYGTTAASSNAASGNIAAAFLTGLSANSVISTTGAINGTSGLASSVSNGAPLTFTNGTAVFAAGTGGSALYTVFYKVIPVV